MNLAQVLNVLAVPQPPGKLSSLQLLHFCHTILVLPFSRPSLAIFHTSLLPPCLIPLLLEEIFKVWLVDVQLHDQLRPDQTY